MMQDEPNEDDLSAELLWQIVFGTQAKQQYAPPPILIPEHDQLLQTVITERGNRILQTMLPHLTAVLLEGA